MHDNARLSDINNNSPSGRVIKISAFSRSEVPEKKRNGTFVR